MGQACGAVCWRRMHHGMDAGGVCGVVPGAHLYSNFRPDAPVSRLVHWVKRAAGPEDFVLVYTLGMLAIIAIIRTGCTFFEYVTKDPGD